MNEQKGCYRCGRSLDHFDGTRYECPNCDRRFCGPCIEAYAEEERTGCPGCSTPVVKFKRRDPVKADPNED